jgi:putative oxidoreductase
MNQIRSETLEAGSKPSWRWFIALAGNRHVVLVFRLVMAAFFLVSSYGKLVDIERYSVDAVYNFGVLPFFLARPFGLIMPFIELLCGLGLLFGVLTRLASLGVGLMSLSFFVAKAIVLLQGRSINCGCFGAVIDTLASVTIFMDVPMVFMALVVLLAGASTRHRAALGNLMSLSWKKRLDPLW